MRHSRSDFGCGFELKISETTQEVPSSLDSSVWDGGRPPGKAKSLDPSGHLSARMSPLTCAAEWGWVFILTRSVVEVV